MTTHISTSQTTTYVASTSGETYIVDPNVRISSVTTPGALVDTMGATGITMEVAGSVVASNFYSGIFSQSTNAHIVVDESGIVIGGGGISVVGAGPADVDNHGYVAGSADGIYILSKSGDITNSGSIIGTTYGIFFVADATRATFSVENSGLIAGATGVEMYAQEGTLTLDAESRVMATAVGIANDGTNLVTKNAGLVSAGGGFAAYQGSAGIDNLTNTGRIVGNVYLGDGADIFRESGTGTIAGSVDGGMGDDTYILSSNKMRVSEANGQGIDTVRSAHSYSLVNEGEIETLTLVGKLKANATGNEYGNTVNGNAGVNHIDGGAGSDMLAGGKGDDLFIFAKGTGNDTVTDYVDGEDRIRISGFDTFHAFKDLVITQNGSDVFIDFGAESATDGLIIEHAKVKEFDKGDFVFA